jgi:hypothetical protein
MAFLLDFLDIIEKISVSTNKSNNITVMPIIFTADNYSQNPYVLPQHMGLSVSQLRSIRDDICWAKRRQFLRIKFGNMRLYDLKTP